MVSDTNTANGPLQHLPWLVLEIGTEEIPARFLPEATARLQENSERLLSEYRLPHRALRSYATPRRLSLMAEIEPLQMASEKEIWGPPVNVAFDEAGNPTRAAQAFAETNGLEISALLRRERGKGTYVVAVVKESSQKTSALLPEIVPKLILSLSFPKSMRWGNGGLRFARPIHWILAMYNNEKLSFTLEDIKAGSTTRGHRFLSPATFEVKDSKAYVNLLRNNFVILDPEERRKIIVEASKKLAASVKTEVVEDEELLQHVVNLVEYPAPVLGTFPPEYLSLPRELLITVMKGHQKYFALQNAGGSLAHYFVVVSNTRGDNAEIIKRGAEKVIKARFEDARFYYEQDRKTAPMDRVVSLRKVIYHDRLGTLHDKTVRMTALADFIASRCAPAKADGVHTAALLSKTDLITGAVREFPELQGIMGMYYARADRFDEDIALALSEQYLPAYSGGRLPETDIGAILSLADKFDNLASFFMLGLPPTGAEDPFALRRQAIGIISILRSRRYDLSITDVLRKAIEPFPVGNAGEILTDLLRFFEQRFEPLFSAVGYPADCIASVVYLLRESPLHVIEGRLTALKAFKDHLDYPQFLLAIKRVNNISPREDMPPLRTDLFDQDDERALYDAAERLRPQLETHLAGNRHLDALRVLAGLREPINNFFDKVLVMDKREEVRRNRLALVKIVQSLSLRIADFTKLS